jgi:hypothetical protein
VIGHAYSIPDDSFIFRNKILVDAIVYVDSIKSPFNVCHNFNDPRFHPASRCPDYTSPCKTSISYFEEYGIDTTELFYHKSHGCYRMYGDGCYDLEDIGEYDTDVLRLDNRTCVSGSAKVVPLK